MNQKRSDLISRLKTLQAIHCMIERGEAETPLAIADEVGISVNSVYNCLNEMQELGAPIVYDRKAKRYKYPVPVSFDFQFRIKPAQ